MQLIMTLLARDEADILKQNLDYHYSQGVDFIVATDNLSNDGSTEILREYERQGRLHYIRENSDTYNQREWVTKMARLARRRYAADWVINNDADEFWLPISGTLKQSFESLPRNINVVLAKRANFVYEINHDEALPFYKRMTYRSVISKNSLGEVLPSKVAHAGRRWVNVGYGSHAVSRVGRQKVAQGLAEILHFPMRSRQQFLHKISQGGAALERNNTLAELDMTTWRDLYKKLTKDGNLDGYFNENSYDEEALQSAIESGALLKDLRMQTALKQLANEES